MKVKKKQLNKGSLLIEVLVSIALFMAISTIIAQAIFASFYGNKESKNKIILNSLLTEQLVKIRALSDEHWDNIGSLIRNTKYYIYETDVGFAVATGTFSSTKDDLPYSIYFEIEDSKRGQNASSSLMLSTTTNPTIPDPSSLIITSAGVIGNSPAVYIRSVITRWRNIICSQKDWSATNSSGVLPCETENIGYLQKNNVELGDTLKLCNGCN